MNETQHDRLTAKLSAEVELAWETQRPNIYPGEHRYAIFVMDFLRKKCIQLMGQVEDLTQEEAE